MNKALVIVLVFVGFIGCCPCPDECSETTTTSVVEEILLPEEPMIDPSTIRGLTANITLPDEKMDRAVSYGTNTLRLMLTIGELHDLDENHNLILNEGEVVNPFKLQRVIDFVTRANARGLKVILDLHETPGLVRWEADWSDARLWNEATSGRFETIVVKTWRILATTFVEYPREMIMYEILNEPAPKVVDSGPEVYGDMWDSLQVKAYNAIRKIDTIHTIIGSPPYNWRVTAFQGWRPPSEFLSDGNVWVAFHHYHPHDYTFQQDVEYKPYPGGIFNGYLWDDGVWNREKMFSILDSVRYFQRRYPTVPVIVTEFSVKKMIPDAQNWMRDVIDSFNDVKIGYVFHSLGESDYLRERFGWDGSPWEIEEGNQQRLEVLKNKFHAP